MRNSLGGPARSSAVVALAALAVALPSIASAQDAPRATIGVATPTGPVPSLFVVNAGGATLDADRLTLRDVAGQAIVFADRPVRAAGHVATAEFVAQWAEGSGSFAVDPPNATVSVLGGDGAEVADAVVELRRPALADGTLTFEVTVLEGAIAGATGPAALFIDTSAWGYGGWNPARADGGGAAPAAPASTYWQAPRLHGAWYQQPEGEAIMRQREDEMDAAGARIMP